MTLFAFLLAVAILILVHEWGHYVVARWAGVKVLRFSLGLGPRLLAWTSARSGTEFVWALIPLGGYVKMLDEREGPVAPQELSMAFSRQPLKIKAAIVAAGPFINLLFAVCLYAYVYYVGSEQAQAILSRPTADSVAAQSGLRGGERVVRVGFEGEPLQPIVSFEDLRWFLSRGVLSKRDVELEWVSRHDAASLSVPRRTVLKLQDIDVHDANVNLWQRIGIVVPFSRPCLGELLEEGPAARSGLRKGDLVLQVDQFVIVDALQLRQIIRHAGESGNVSPQSWRIEREGVQQTVFVMPTLIKEGEQTIARVGAFIGESPASVLVHYGALQSVLRALEKTREIFTLSLKTLGNILTGQSSWKNLSGPLTIAEYAAKSAEVGITQFLLFLAWVSVSLGVFNLLPVPILDGGYLMYYLWESLTRRPLSDVWIERLQKLGLVVLAAMVSVAVFNDLVRFWG